MARIAKLLMLFCGIALVLPATPSVAEAAAGPPHVRKRRRYVPPPPPPHRRRVIRRQHVHRYQPTPTPRPRQPIVEDRTSVYLGIGALGTFITREDSLITDPLESGAGLDIFLGYRFNRIAAIELGGLFSFHGSTRYRREETELLAGMTADMKFFFLPWSERFEPFVQLGGGLYLLSPNDISTNEYVGGGLQLGGGVDIRLARMFAIGLRVLYRGIFLDNSAYSTRVERDFVNTVTLGANIQVHF